MPTNNAAVECPSQLEGWIMTASGIRFWPLAPRVEDVRITDIAHALAHCCRFQGMCWPFYSVAEHSVRVSDKLAGREALYGLLHDASEAYLGDVPRPLKAQPVFAAYRDAERTLQAVIYRAFGLRLEHEPASVKLVDRRMRRTEQRALMPPAWHGEVREDVEVYPEEEFNWPNDADAVFLQRFEALTR